MTHSPPITLLAAIVLCLMVCVSALLPATLIAHGSGASYEEEKNGYLIDIGYGPDAIAAGQRLRLDFDLIALDISTTSDLFTDVWVRITKGDELYFSANVAEPYFGPTVLNLLLPDPGEYDIYTRYQNDATNVVDTTFTLLVATSSTTASPASAPGWLSVTTLFTLGGGLITGALVAWYGRLQLRTRKVA